MDINKESIKDFFDKASEYFAIPEYQRYYSWTRDNWAQLLDDIKDQAETDTQYFFGNILLDRNTADSDCKLIVDGQQRLTTLIILMRCLITTLGPNIDSTEYNEQKLKQRYIYAHHPKLKISSLDNDYFNQLIIQDAYNPQLEPSSESQKKKLIEQESFSSEKLSHAIERN